jgi:formamidopyrimidine-DNA glycosylase
MPELPEVETVRRGLALKMTGRHIVTAELRRQDLRRPFPPMLARRLTGAAIGELKRRGKYILIELDDDGTLLLHLGMSGRITAGPGGAPHALHDHVVLTLDDGTVVRFNDARRFGLLDYMRRGDEGAHPLLAGMGPEPLGPGFDGSYLGQKLAGKMTPIKAALLDQKIVAGLGNIYVCEALHRARLSPMRLASTIADRRGAPNERAERLVESIKAVLNDAIKDGGSSLRDHKLTDGELGMFQHRFRVYGREGEKCRTSGCRGIIKRIVQNGRSTFYCPACQK